MGEKIAEVHAREILDSRGNPTIEATVRTKSGIMGIAAVPSGASVGTHEALELRDGDKRRYGGLGVLHAIKNVRQDLAETVIGIDVTAQDRIDEKMCKRDGTPNKSRLGANAILAVSLAVARAGAASQGMELFRYLAMLAKTEKDMHLPVPMMNLLNGGRHANFAIDIQECLIMPLMPTFRERVRAGAEVFHSLGAILKKKKLSIGVGDEGGYAPQLSSNREAFVLLEKAVEEAGYSAGKDIVFGMDVAASEFFDQRKKMYTLARDNKMYTSEQMIALYKTWMDEFPLRTIEDGLAEDEWEGWKTMTAQLETTLVGDDLFVTDKARLTKGIKEGVANAILIKVNQIGTLTETLETISVAKRHGYAIAVSHRSGETADTFIADLAVGVGAEYIKTGSLSRSERIEKYNRLMAIEAALEK